MTSSIATRRLEIFAAARGLSDTFIRFDPSNLRYSLGTSFADLRIPVKVEPVAHTIIRASAIEVALLLVTQYKRIVPPDDLDRLMLREDYRDLPRVVPGLGASGGGADLRAAAALAPTIHPALSGGIICAWMGPGGKGRSLTGLWIELLRRAFEEMGACRGSEETPLLVALALTGEMIATAQDVRDALPGPPIDRFLRAGVHTALWIAARTGLARAWRDSGRPVNDPMLLRIDAVLSPFTLLGGRNAFAASGSALYGCELAAGLPQADEIFKRLVAGQPLDPLLAEAVAALDQDEELARRAEQAVALERIRAQLVAAVVAAEVSGQPGRVAAFAELCQTPGAMLATFADDASRKELAGRLGDEAAAMVGEPGAGLEKVARAVRAWKAREPGTAVGLRREAARREYGASMLAVLCDQALEKLIAPARRALELRTGSEAEGGAEEEYEAGRLYRLSARGGAILKSRVEHKLGHLFADVKDFTRRTSLLGQAAMAEFLRREFYLPIFVAAKQHYSGMQHLADRGGVSLNNLLGDAISFSGDIEAMVTLAGQIRVLLLEYESRLRREVTTEMVAQQMAGIEERYARELESLAQEAGAASAELARCAPGTKERDLASAQLTRARAEAARVSGELERARARARGEGLEAGVFIAYGSSPLVITIDDDVFGKSRVAIADKINESARGTARAGGARARADALLAAERARRNNPGLAHAWSVFIGQPLSFTLPAEVEALALHATRSGDLVTALRAVAMPVREALQAGARGGGEQPGDIYNSGAALSEEAMEAFLEVVGPSRTVRRVELDAQQIPEELRARWFFGVGVEKVVVAFHPTGQAAEVFRRVGKAAFKGLSEVVVWELCSNSGAPRALVEAFGSRWLKSGG